MNLIENLILQSVLLIVYIALLVFFKPLMERYAQREFKAFHFEGFVKFLDYSIFAILLNYPFIGLVYFTGYILVFSISLSCFKMIHLESQS